MILFIWWHLQRYQVKTFLETPFLIFLRYLDLQTRLKYCLIVFLRTTNNKISFYVFGIISKLLKKLSTNPIIGFCPKNNIDLYRWMFHIKDWLEFFSRRPKGCQSSLILTLKMEIERESIGGSSGTALEIYFDGREFKYQFSKAFIHFVTSFYRWKTQHVYPLPISS